MSPVSDLPLHVEMTWGLVKEAGMADLGHFIPFTPVDAPPSSGRVCPLGSFREREKWLGTRSLVEEVENGKVDSGGMDGGGGTVEG